MNVQFLRGFPLAILSQHLFDFFGELSDSLYEGQGVVLFLLLKVSDGDVEHDDCIVAVSALVLKALAVLVETVVDEVGRITKITLFIKRYGELLVLVAHEEIDIDFFRSGHVGECFADCVGENSDVRAPFRG